MLSLAKFSPGEEVKVAAAGCERIFTDHAPTARLRLDAVLDYLRPGDVLVGWKFDRLGRSLRNFIDTMTNLDAAGIRFRSLTEGVDTSTAAGRMVANIFGFLAEFERELIWVRTNAGLAVARARGRVGGRPTVMTPERLSTARQLRDDGATLDMIAKTLGVGRATVVRALSDNSEVDASAT